MSRAEKWKRTLKRLYSFALFFAIVAFTVTCCMTLFLHLMMEATGIVLLEENIRTAAILTLLNVMGLSLLFTLIDWARRSFMVDRPVKRIVRGAEQVMAGNLTVHVKPFSNLTVDEGFNEIIRCFNRMVEELSHTETLRTDFVSNVSHELKTPLSAIQNYATLLNRPDLPEVGRAEYTRAIQSASQRLTGLITNILKLNKLENQQIFPAPKPFDLTEQLCRCILQFERIWEEKAIHLNTDLAEGVTVTADEELLELVWNNLLSNAFKFTPEGGTVSVRLCADGGGAVISVADTGCGISPKTGVRIFEKFYQEDTSHAVQGNGLGLALVKRVVDITGDEISVESTLGQGSTFTVKIPG